MAEVAVCRQRVNNNGRTLGESGSGDAPPHANEKRERGDFRPIPLDIVQKLGELWDEMVTLLSSVSPFLPGRADTHPK